MALSNAHSSHVQVLLALRPLCPEFTLTRERANGNRRGVTSKALRIQENIPLSPLTTFKVGGLARFFVEAATEEDVKAAVEHASERQWPLFILGGGSNLVIADEGWPGLVLKIAIPGIIQEDDVFQVGAGQDWDTFVAHAVARNYTGIECLSGIPGTVGGTPIQNVGAYGQEAAEVILTVRVLEIANGQIYELDSAQCGFGYRSSVFNTTEQSRYIVLRVSYRLAKNGKATVEYADLQKYFSNTSGTPSLQQVRDAVRTIRQSKAMLLVEGDDDCRSAGSFFKNPVVSQAEADRIEAHANEISPKAAMPRFEADDGLVKLSAAWLLEHAGIHKGYGHGPVGISRKHTLSIVNRGGATAHDIIALKNEIQQRVLDVWGVSLHPEPVFVGLPGSRD
ncbi:MAG TPA: UDP-N-acetylmuramate dehydrogenase [Candidatus Angelobacter sp.]|jgi:UDP-N-acetylmuramate dehydrogenase|nr:UDP-N-acetylmuramate dehydrogenase [Candidatus Angelobacter sp.]